MTVGQVSPAVPARRIAMVAYTQLSTDARVLRAARAAVEAGYAVDFYTLNEQGAFAVPGLTIIRSKLFQRRTGKFNYILSYLRFFFFCLIRITLAHLRRPYAVCHVNNMPNFLVFSCLVPKLTGARLVLDLHDLMPEQFIHKFGVGEKSWLARILLLEERWSANICDELITVDFRLIEKFRSRGIRPPITIVLNTPEREQFHAVASKHYDPAVVRIVFASSLHSNNTGVDYLLQAAKVLLARTGAFRLEIYGQGEYLDRAIELAEQLQLGEHVYFSRRFLGHEELSRAYDGANIGVVAVGRNIATEYGIPMKMFEYFAKKIAVVMSDIPSNTGFFGELGLKFQAGNALDCAAQLEHLIQDRELMRRFAEKGFEFYQQHSWHTYKKAYVDLLAHLSATAAGSAS